MLLPWQACPCTQESLACRASERELGRTVFGHWLMVDPGQTSTATIEYELPWRLTEIAGSQWRSWASYVGWSPQTQAYNLMIETQPGTGETDFSHTFQGEKELVIVDSSEPVLPASTGWLWHKKLVTNSSLHAIFTFK